MFETASERAHEAQWQAIGVFLIASLSACSIMAIGYSQAAEFGAITPDLSNFNHVLIITACISVPIGCLAAYHQWEIDGLKRQLQDGGPVDDLTGLIDSHLFERVLLDEVARMDRSGRPSAIALLEIDGFSKLEERYGGGFGNSALKQVAADIHSQLRGPFDKVCRWQGPVFVVLMNDVSIGQAEQICERLREARADEDLHYKGHSTFATLSLGVAALAPGADISHAFERAQIGIEKAQRYGGNKVSNGGAWIGER